MFYHKDYINLRYYQCHQKSVVLGSCQIHGNRCKFSKILIIYWKLKLYHWQQRLSVVFFEVTASLHSFLRIWQTLKPEKMTVENTFILSSKNYVLWEKKASVYFLFCDPEYFLNGEYYNIYICFFFLRGISQNAVLSIYWAFSGGPVAKTLHSQRRGPRFIPWSGNSISYATTKTQHSQINKEITFSKNVLMGEETEEKRQAWKLNFSAALWLRFWLCKHMNILNN